MDIIKAIKTRQTVRAFKSTPVSREILQELLETAIRAPSWANTQTWELVIASGEVLEDIRSILVAKALANDERRPDLPRPEWPSPYRDRTKENGTRLFQMLDIGRDTPEKQQDWMLQMHGFFGAPDAIFITTEKGISSWALFNTGLLCENIALAALQYGLGTAMLASVAGYAEEVKDILNVPSSKQLILGIAIGYPELQSPANAFRSNREPLDSITSWHGF